jgi:hypothetical protein
MSKKNTVITGTPRRVENQGYNLHELHASLERQTFMTPVGAYVIRSKLKNLQMDSGNNFSVTKVNYISVSWY